MEEDDYEPGERMVDGAGNVVTTRTFSKIYGLGGLRLGYRSDAGLDVAIVGRNITDEIVVDGGINFLNHTAFINEPSFWGVEVRKDW